MKRLLLFVVLILHINYSAFSLDGESSVNIGLSVSFPIDKDAGVGANILGSLLLSTITIGGGYHLNIIENIFSPGIYGDVHMSLLSILLHNDDDNDEKNKKDDESLFLFFQTGLRVYNQFKFGYFDIQPFFGFNLMFGSVISPILLKAFGILVIYNEEIGIEYSFQMPYRHKNSIYENNSHRIVLMLKIG